MPFGTPFAHIGHGRSSLPSARAATARSAAMTSRPTASTTRRATYLSGARTPGSRTSASDWSRRRRRGRGYRRGARPPTRSSRRTVRPPTRWRLKSSSRRWPASSPPSARPWAHEAGLQRPDHSRGLTGQSPAAAVRTPIAGHALPPGRRHHQFQGSRRPPFFHGLHADRGGLARCLTTAQCEGGDVGAG